MPERLVRHGVVLAVAGFCIGLVGSTITATIYAVITGASVDSFGVQMAGLPGLWIGLLGVPLVASRKWGSGDLGRDLGLRIVWRDDVVRGVVAGLIGQFVVVFAIVEVFTLLSPKLTLSEASVDLAKRAHGGGLVALAILFGLAAPVVEEIYFRGLLQRSLQRRLPLWPAIGIAGAFFGLVHYGGSGAGAAALVLALAAFGWILGALVARSGRLGPAIVAHVTFNVIATIQLTVESFHGK